MKCILQKSTTEYTEYRFVQTGSSDAVIKYSNSNHTVRLSNNEDHGFYYIEQQQGILKSRIVFKNAYGSEVGKIVIDHWQNQFVVNLNECDYHCMFSKNEGIQMTVSQQQHKKIINSCKVELESGDPIFTEKTMSSREASLVLAACWYMNVALKEERQMIQSN